MSYSEASARNALRQIGTTPEEVRKLTGLPEPSPKPQNQPKPPAGKAKPSPTRRSRRVAAKRAFVFVKDGICPNYFQALKKAKLPRCYIAGLRECVQGDGPITRAVRAGDLKGLTPQDRQTAVFIRWFYDINIK